MTKLLTKVQRAALYIFFFSINFEMWDPLNTGGALSIAKLTAIIYFITIIPQIPQFIRIDGIKTVLFPIWIFFGLLTFMSLINRNELFSGFFYLPTFLNIMLFWLLINHERIDYLIIEKGMVWFALGSATLALLFIAGIGVEYGEGRLSMFGENQNVLGIKVSVSLVILLLFVTQNRLNISWIRYLLLPLVPLMLFFIGETGSRVSLISFVLAFLVGTALYKTKTKILKISILLGNAIVLILFAILLMQSDIMVERLQNTSDNAEIGSRDKIWKAVFPIVKENPILGIGETGYDFKSTFIFGTAFSPHNVFLEILCYTGIIGLSIYLTFLFQVFKKGFQAYTKKGLLLPMLLIIPMLGLLLSGQILNVKLGWTIFAYIVSSSAIAMKSLKNDKEKTFINEYSLRN